MLEAILIVCLVGMVAAFVTVAAFGIAGAFFALLSTVDAAIDRTGDRGDAF